jgi:ABC-type sugar transport system ATPase subunit
MEVSLANLEFKRNERAVLQIPSLIFPSGTTTALFGPNGSGKTTLLRVIAGLEQPGTGEVRIGHRRVEKDPEIPQRVGISFQTPIFLRGTVRHNLDLALRLRKVAAGERESRIEQAARECGVADLLERSARQLSGGEGQRVNLARALALRAPVTLLDEPLAGIDRITRGHLLADLPRLLATFATTSILVTHDREEAFRLADRLVVLMEGRVKAAGPKKSVYAHPPDRHTAELLGYTVLAAEEKLVAIPPGGLRAGPGTLRFRLLVKRVVDMGNHVHVVGTVGDEPVDVRWPEGAPPAAEGSEITVSPGPGAVVLGA